ncbi:DUF1104 domain-containing protein [Helicobacter sp. WB40]|uniref:DUF1104 domain-containing protein n=1 Tax=Helicobacter ibis TaxID=2962633 RepID=A0ABT4VFZ8_9HELI|nr:DUF1104 domain-containing protein [Helicobacter sp. WB40]MDA3966361.1 DUF1104 domain-containing protein [Helicobacter sp. WB40]MDA3969025.1 DUF1104 domain-containing protein [Helicobacter ibis]
MQGYRITVHSKMNNMKMKDAREFREKICKNKRLAMDNMTMKEYRAYRLQAREAGSFGYGGYKHASALDINCNSNYRQRLISSVLWLK